MENLIKRDLNQLFLITRTAFEFNETDKMREQVLCLLEKLFRCPKLTFFLARNLGEEINFERVISLGIGGEFFKQYCEYYFQRDPYFKQYFSAGKPVFTTEQVIPFKDLISSEYYNDFLKHQHVYYQLFIRLRSGERALGYIGMGRPKEEFNFSTQERAKAELIAPHLSAALERTIVLENSLKHNCILNQIAMDLPYKMSFVLDESLEIIYLNKNVTDTISVKQSKEEYREKQLYCLPMEIYQRCQELRNVIRLKKNLETYQEKFNLVDQVSGKKMSFILRIINTPNKLPLFLFYLKPDEPITYTPSLKKEFGLTPRELDIINLIYQALKNSEIADKLFISEHTVKNHIFNIFEKIGVNNRTGLVQWVIRMTMSI